MYWTGALGGAMVLFCGMGLAVGKFSETPKPECSLKVLDDGSEIVTCQDGTVSRLDRGSEDESAMDFRGRELDGVDLRDFDLRGARFDGATLTNVELRGVDLTGASFQGATLYFVDLRETKLDGVDLKDAVITKSYLDGVTWAETVCPTGVLSSSNFGTCRGQLSKL